VDANFTNPHAVIRALRQLASEGWSLQPRSMEARHATLWKAIHRFFSSYQAALASADVDPSRLEKRTITHWSRQRIIERLKELAAAGTAINIGSIQKCDQRLGAAIYFHFPSHDEALKAAGFDPATVRQARTWTPEQVLAEIRKRHRRGEDLSNTYVNEHVAPLFGAMCRYFGSHADALRAAGIDPEKVRKPWPLVWPTERILGEIRQFYAQWWKTHPRTQPPRPRLSAVNIDLSCAARQRFGTLGAALRAAGIDDRGYRSRRTWTKDGVLALLRQLRKEGTVLSYAAISQADSKVVDAARNRFGSLRAAVKAAGLLYVRANDSARKRRR
jgi:hypothetical protein